MSIVLLSSDLNYFNKKSVVFCIIVFLYIIIVCILIAVFQIFSWSLVFGSLSMMCLNMIFLVFILVRVHWTSWICRLIAFPNPLNILSQYFIKKIFFVVVAALSLFPPLGLQLRVYVKTAWCCPIDYWGSVHFFHHFLSVFQWG